MVIQALRSIFPEKKPILQIPESETIRNNYLCDDKSLEGTIQHYLNGSFTAGECIRKLLWPAIRDKDFRIIENKEIFPLTADLLDVATWKTEWTQDCCDYNPHHPEYRLNFLSNDEAFHAKIAVRDYSPKEALLMIRERWDRIYHKQATYEAIEYCIAASENHSNLKYFGAAFRDYGRKMGSLYRELKEK